MKTVNHFFRATPAWKLIASLSFPRLTALFMIVSAMIVVLFTAAAPVLAQDDTKDQVRRKLAGLDRPWEEKVHRITREEYEETLRFWGERHDGILKVEQVGASLEEVPIYLMVVTDRTVPDDDKSVCLITSLHGGPERSGTSTVLHLAEWLLGDDPEAVETRRRQIVLLMPIVNPYAYFVTDRFGNSKGIDPYTGNGGGTPNWDLKTLTFKQLDKSPEIEAFLSVVDRFRPEVHCDLHGTGLQEIAEEELGDRRQYQGNTMFELSGSAYSNFALRPWDWRVTEAMIGSAQQAGYGSDRFEADAQRLFWGPVMQPFSDRLWLGRANFYTSQIAYAKYHTMPIAMEIGWEESGVARVKGLLRLANKPWGDRFVAGYPVDRVKSYVGHFIAAGGVTARERRDSRAALWNRQAEFSQAILYPQTAGRDTYFVALTPEAGKLLDENKTRFLANLRQRPEIQTGPIEAFFEMGPENKVIVSRGQPCATAEKSPIRHAIALRMRIPYRRPDIVDVRLNGRLLKEDAANGYQSRFADGFTQLQINIPSETAAANDLLLVTCAYRPDVKRVNGWTPPRGSRAAS